MFWERWPRLFYDRLLVWFTVHRLAKFGRVPFADLHLRSLAMMYSVSQKHCTCFCNNFAKTCYIEIIFGLRSSMFRACC